MREWEGGDWEDVQEQVRWLTERAIEADALEAKVARVERETAKLKRENKRLSREVRRGKREPVRVVWPI